MNHELAIADLSLDEMRENTVTLFREGGGTRPDVRVIQVSQQQYVLKDYSSCSPWFRNVMGPLLTRREAQALNALDHVEGVPRLIATLGRCALLMEYVQDSDRARKRLPLMDQGFFDRLDTLLRDVHARGVAHCDLRRSSNILTDEDGNPYLVDFVSCVFRGDGWNPLSTWVYRAFCRADRNAVIKLKQRVAPDLMTDTERRNANHNFFDRVIRGLGKALRAIIRIFLTGRHNSG